MTTPSPALLGKLARTKLLTRWQQASIGHGERRSRAKGAGMEFADHRDYQPGDELRHIDPHLYARTGKTYIRQYDVYKQLPITIFVDSSRSMAFGEPRKFDFAAQLAATIGFIGLAGGDQVQLAFGAGDHVRFSPRFHGALRAPMMFAWIDDQQPQSAGTLGPALQTVLRGLNERGLLVVLSDWWEEGLEHDLRIAVAAGQELWGLHVVAPEELDASLLGSGEVRLVDVESGHEIELSLDRGTRDRYQHSLDAWRAELQSTLTRIKGRYMLVPTNTATDKLLLQDWRRLGIIG